MTTKTRNITFMPSGTSRARSTRGLLAVAVCGLFVAMSAPSAQACITAGGCDGFGNGPVSTTQRADFAAWFAAGPPTAGSTYGPNHYCSGLSLPFDSLQDNCSFGHSLEPVPAPGLDLYSFCCSADQDLQIHLKAGPSIPSTDGLALVFIPGGPGNTPPARFAWSISLNALDGSGLCIHRLGMGTPDGQWNANEEMDCVLDLCNLPPYVNSQGATITNLQSAIRARGAVDVFVQDDTGVDCLGLCWTTCTKGPAVSVWGLGALALLLLSGVALKFGRRRAAA